MTIQEQDVWTALRTVKEPESIRDIVSLNMVREVHISDDGVVSLDVVYPEFALPSKTNIDTDIKRAVIQVPGVRKIALNGADNKPAAPQAGAALPTVRNILAVASCKGGVGKSTVALNIAIALSKTGARVGILDADIYGPNLPLMTGLNGEQITVRVNEVSTDDHSEIMEPICKFGLKIMSLGFLIHEGQPVVWRGPMLNSAIRQFLTQVDWGNLDYLVVDLPPGTGDVQLSLLQMVSVTGVVHVTTPQDVALQDVRRGIAMFDGMKVPTLGIVENMSSFTCPACKVVTPVFSTGGGLKIANTLQVPFLGAIPLDPAIGRGGDLGVPVTVGAPESVHAQIFFEISDQIALRMSARTSESPASPFAQVY